MPIVNSDRQLTAWFSPIESIDLTKPRYDQKTYLGRFRHFCTVTSPSTLLTTDAGLEEARAIVRKVVNKEEGYQSIDVERAWRAKQIVDSTTGVNGKLFVPFRFSAFVPMNMFTLFFMLHPAHQTPARSMFWQWWNQTYNSAVNHANRGDSGETNYASLLQSYCLAVGISCGVSFAGGKLIGRFGDRIPGILRLFVPYVAVATASVANIVMVRRNDYTNGVSVFDESTGEELPGRSKLAGRTAITQVAISRLLVPLPLMTVPPILCDMLYRRSAWLAKRRRSLDVPVNLSIIVALLMVVTPACIAVFPQETVMSVKDLEPEYHSLVNKKGEPITKVKFNKGL